MSDPVNLYRVSIFFQGHGGSLVLSWRDLKVGAEKLAEIKAALRDAAPIEIEDDFSNALTIQPSAVSAVLGCAIGPSNHMHLLNAHWRSRLQAESVIATLDDDLVKDANRRLRQAQMQGPIVMPPGNA